MKKTIATIIIGLLILIGLFISYKLYSDVENQTIENQYLQQELHAKQAALSIENFFDNFHHSLDFLSKKNDIIIFSESSKILLKNYFEAHIDELKGITRISPEGKIIYTYPENKNLIGLDVSKQKHNAEIIRTKSSIISDVFTTVQGYRAIAYAYPIFSLNGNYEGALTLIIPFDYIANMFLKDLTLGVSGTSFVISENGIELFCSQPSHIGKSVFESSSGNDDLIKMINNMLAKEDGRFNYFYKNLIKNEPIPKIAVYKHVKLQNTFWSIAIMMSEYEVLEVNRGFITKFIGLMTIMAIITILLIYFYARQRRKTREIVQEKELKYKNDLEKLVDIRTKELNNLNVSLQNDIKERKIIEQELKNAIDRVEKSEKIKSEFLAQMSHEIRTPINTILSFSGLIKDELSQFADEELSYGFSGIQSAGKRLIRTIDLILNMSDFQLGTQDYIPKEIEICEDILDKLIVEYKVQVNEKKLNLEIINNSKDNKIIADSYSVHQIFANLIDNAIKYTNEGSIVIECNRNENDNLEVIITDTGVGISEEYLPKIFDEFSQEVMGYTREFEGNGLGLALVKRYCELNNAEILVKSKKGEGTKFTVKFLNN